MGGPAHHLDLLVPLLRVEVSKLIQGLGAVCTVVPHATQPSSGVFSEPDETIRSTTRPFAHTAYSWIWPLAVSDWCAGCSRRNQSRTSLPRTSMSSPSGW